MFRKCAVTDCNSLRKDVKLHLLPKTEKRRNMWLTSLCDNLNDINMNTYSVCHKHFEKKFVNLKTNHLRANAFPTLFTDLEISSGIPEETDAELKVTDHNYVVKGHNDHSYCNATGQAFLLQGTQDNGKSKFQVEECVQLEEDNVSLSDENQNNEGQWDEEINMDDDDEDDVVAVDESFSWNCPEKEIVVDDIADNKGVRNSKSTEEVTTIDDDPDTQTTKKVILPCIQCRKTIIGCAWVCLQCEDHFLCEGCEREFPHRDHYALRVPADRDPVEVASFLDKFRFEIFFNIGEIKEETLEEELETESESTVPDCDADWLPDSQTESLLDYDSESLPDLQPELPMDETLCALEPLPYPVTVQDPLSDNYQTEKRYLEIIRTVKSGREKNAPDLMTHKVLSLTNASKANPNLLSKIKTHPTNVNNLKAMRMNKTIKKSIAPAVAETQIQSPTKAYPQKRPAKGDGDGRRDKKSRSAKNLLETS